MIIFRRNSIVDFYSISILGTTLQHLPGIKIHTYINLFLLAERALTFDYKKPNTPLHIRTILEIAEV